jgi:hypothetical protein
MKKMEQLALESHPHGFHCRRVDRVGLAEFGARQLDHAANIEWHAGQHLQRVGEGCQVVANLVGVVPRPIQTIEELLPDAPVTAPEMQTAR